MFIFLLYSISYIIYLVYFWLYSVSSFNFTNRDKSTESTYIFHFPLLASSGTSASSHHIYQSWVKVAMVKVRLPRRRDGHASKRPAMCFVFFFFNMFFQRKTRGESGIGWDFLFLKVFWGRRNIVPDFAMWVQVYFLGFLWANVIWGRLLNPVTVMKASTVFCVFLAGPQMLWLSFLSCHGTSDWIYPWGL